MLETGDFGGDKFSGLTRYVEEPRQADVQLGSTSAGCRVRRWLTLGCAWHLRGAQGGPRLMGGQCERVRGQSRELLYSIPTALCEEIASAATAELADRQSIPD